MTLSPARGRRPPHWGGRGPSSNADTNRRSTQRAVPHTHTHTQTYIIKLVMHVSHRLREAKKDKKVPPFFLCYLFLAKKFLAAEVLPGCYGRWQLAPANGGALCIQCEDNGVGVWNSFPWILYYMHVKEFDRSVGASVGVEDDKTDGVNLKSVLTRNRIKPARRK